MLKLQGKAAVERARNLVMRASDEELAMLRADHHIESGGNYPIAAIGQLSDSTVETIAETVKRANHG